MADEIIQTLGFDASAAISEITKLNKALGNLDKGLGNAALACTTFNPKASATSSELQKLAKDADAAAVAVGRLKGNLSGIPQTPLPQVGGGAAGGGRGAPGGGLNPAAVQAQIENIRANVKAPPADASAVSKRAFESALTNAAELAVRTGQSLGDVNSIQNNLASSFTGNANRMADAIGKVGSASQKSFHDANRDLRKLTVDFNTFIRIVSTQAIIRALSRIQDAFSDAVEGAAEFQTKVAQIETISNGFGADKIANEVRKISDAFNIPLVDSANALYQTFSNQVGSTADSLSFFGETAKFSKGSVSTLKDSVDLLSGALNSFQLGADQTGNVAGKFFKAIELGRLTASDLANTFGRVGPKAAEMGISLDEVLAALATITQAGVKPSEAITQLQGVIQAFLKPTEAMQDALQKLGFSSAAQVFQANDLGQALRALKEATGGSAEEFNKLFPNIRGVNGALLVGGRGAGTFARALEDIRSATSALNDEKANIVINTDAQKAEQQLNKLRNFLTVDFGQSVLKVVASFSRFTGGADNLILTVKNFTPALIAGGVALGIYAGKLLLMSLNASLAGARLGGLTAALLGLGLAISAGNSIGNIINDKIFGPIFDREKNVQSTIKAAQERGAQEVEAARKTNDAIIQSASARVQKLNAIYFQDVNNAVTASKRLEEGYKRSFDNILSARERLVDELRRQEENARQSQIESGSRVADLVEKSEDRSFDRRLRGLNDLQKVSALNERALKTAALAQKQLLADPGDPKSVERALKQFEKAQGLGEQAEEIGRRVGNRTAEFRAAETLNQITKQQIQAEQQLSAIQKARQVLLEKEREKQEALVESMKEDVKTILENTGDFDKKGNLFKPDEIAQRDKARQKATQDLLSKALSQKDLKALDVLGLAKFANEFKSELTTKPTEVALSFEKSLAELRAGITKSFAGLDEKIPFKRGLEVALGKELKTPDELLSGLEEARNKVDQLNQSFANLATQSTVIRETGSELRSLLAEVNATGSVIPLKGAGADLAKEISAQIAAAASNPAIANFDLSAIEKKIAELKKLSGADSFLGLGKNIRLSADTEKLEIALTLLRRIKEARDNVAKNPVSVDEGASRGQLNQLNSLIQTLDPAAPIERAAAALQGAGATAASAFSQAASAAQGSVSATAQIAANWERAAAAAQRAAAAAGGGGEGFARGGFVRPRYFADGGPVGTDRIPAWLSSGEMVMNRGATSRFFAQLTAMNSGHAKVPAATRVGDTIVNLGGVNVTESRTPQQTGRAVVSDLRRLFRRGISRGF